MSTRLLAPLAMVVALGGCDPDSIGEQTHAVLTFNGRYLNGRYLNGSQINGLDLADPSTRETLEYLVSCALDADAEVVAIHDGVSHMFAGEIGLAPEWADGACGHDCQRWISACLLARVNARGEHVEISMRARHPALRPDPGELAAFAAEEGSYYGNLFIDPPVLHAASAREDLALPRTCGAELSTCPIEVVGHAADACDGWSRAHGRDKCRDADGELWDQVITVHLR